MRQLTAEQSAFFDTVRGGGCLYVATVHALQLFGLPYPSPLPQMGLLWIGAFFVLSGFLIHRALLRHDWRAFVRSRSLRVLPPFICAMMLTAALWGLAPLFFASGSHDLLSPTSRVDFSLDYFVSTLLLVNGLVGGTVPANGPLWTLAVDIWLYALAAMCVVGGRWKLIAALFIAIIIIRAPAYLPFMLAFLAGWCWSALHVQGRADVPRIAFRPFACAAPFSYTLYIFHFPMLLFLYGATGERPWMMLPSLVAVIAVCAVVGPAVEEMGHRLSRRRAGDEQRVAVRRPAAK
jgi:peptidoglycan/LPS O-acetylase OafA/YrhL